MTNDQLHDAIVALVPPLLTALDGLALAGRHLHPPNIRDVADAVGDFADPVNAGKAQVEALEWPEHLQDFRQRILAGADEALAGLEGLQGAVDSPEGPMAAYAALRHNTRAQEALYPLSAVLPTVSQFFLLPAARDDKALLEQLANVDRSRGDIGIFHHANDRAERGGYSVYAPEQHEAGTPLPVVIVLHGGSGHGADFLWTWLKAARTRNVLVISPSSQDRTWSLQNPAFDGQHLIQILNQVEQRWPIDRSRVLLTGMSDGGSFAWLVGLGQGVPFTHLAPISASFHPMLLQLADGIQDKPIYLVHGALDWMFPIQTARDAASAATEAGAKITFREIDDLSHTYPREENGPILDWFLSPGA